jgi:hypothetical protein
MVEDAGMAANSADQLTRQPRRAQGTWRVFALVEVLLAAKRSTTLRRVARHWSHFFVLRRHFGDQRRLT